MQNQPNPLRGWQLRDEAISHVGHDLSRPECVLAEADGTLWAADARGGVMRINPDGTQQLVTQKKARDFDLQADAHGSLVEGTLPNGMAFAANGDILIANFGTDKLEIMDRQGYSRVLHDTIDGQPMGKLNFVLRDSKNRIWITVSTRVNPWPEALRSGLDDGYIALLDDKGLRIVADGINFSNEIRLDEKEEWLYIAETTAKRVSRFRVQPDGSLTNREIYGPSNLGTGLIDGITFDAYGNLWLTMVFADRLMAITPEGDALTLYEDKGNPGIAKLEEQFASGEHLSFDNLMASYGKVAPWMASVTFGGPDLKTVYLGSLRATTLPSFISPVAGLPMVHWNSSFRPR
jgi:sugar lactone lactonase YvrE